MSSLPYSLVVGANITKATNFSAKASFQTLLLLANSENEVIRGKVYEYQSLSAASKDNASDTIKKMVSVIFSQQVTPASVKVAYLDATQPIADELSRISNIDNNWVLVAVAHEVTDSSVAISDSIATWMGASSKIVGILDKDVKALDKNELSLTRNFKEKSFNRAFATYASNEDEELSLVGALAYMSTVNFDEKDSFYTLKFANITGVKPVNLSVSEYKNLTGFVPNQGLDKSVGNFGNVFTNIGDGSIFTEGCMASGELISVEHAMLWLRFTIQYEIYNVFKNNKVVPYINRGVGMLVSALQIALGMAVSAGIIPENGYKINSQKILDVPESKRANHIAPLITWKATLSGAIHYSSVNGEVKY